MVAVFVAILLGQHHQIFKLSSVSKLYDVTVRFTQGSSDDSSMSEGSADIVIRSKRTGKLVQTIHQENFALSKNELAKDVQHSGSQPSPYDDDYSIVFEDFNFDGIPDLAICNGTQSSYGLPSYDIFLYNPVKHLFIRSKSLSNLAEEHLGLFLVDAKKHHLLVYDKSGAAWHQTSIYRMDGNEPVLIETETQDDTGPVEVNTSRILVGRHWRAKVRKVSLPKG